MEDPKAVVRDAIGRAPATIGLNLDAPLELGEFGARVEDVYVVTETGGVRLNKTPSELVVV
jgi:Xaa-Pro aminopeptidase